MKRLATFMALGLFAIPATALATDLDELLESSGDASYTAEQLITCDTPDGVRDVLIDLEQKGGEIRYGNRSQNDPEIWSGNGGWSGPTGGSKIKPKAEGSPEAEVSNGTYTLDEGSPTQYLGRSATSYVLMNGDVSRAELVVDDELGVFLSVTSFDANGETYCERRFVSFEATTPDWTSAPAADGQTLDPQSETTLPDILGDFRLVDVFSDNSGLTFAYYSDGFFSFAVFQSPVTIQALDSFDYSNDNGSYHREFTPGQVTYTWTVSSGGMALVGDLPPDMHEAVLAGLEYPSDPGFLNRLWRRIFG